MVKVFVGHKGSGKTKKIIQLANDMAEVGTGSIVFINKDHSLTYDLKHMIRVVCMEEYEHITNIDEYIGFIYGIISSDHDIQVIFIDGILHHKDVHIPDIKEFLGRLINISKGYDLDFVVSLSAAKEALGDALEGCEVLD